MARRESPTAIIPVETIEQVILYLRDQRVILDADLARLYAVPTKALNQAVKRNIDRFPADFMFRLSAAEKRKVVTNCDHLAGLKFSTHLPTVFTERGAIMAANVLNSPRAIVASVFVVRAFVKLRHVLATHHELAAKLVELEGKLQQHDGQILALINAIRQLMEGPDEPAKPPVGYATELAGAAGRAQRRALRRTR